MAEEAKKEWWEYIVNPVLGGIGMGFVNPVMNLFGLGPEQPPAQKPPEPPNRLAALLAEREEKRRQRMAQMQMQKQNYSAVNQPNQEVMAALERVRRNWRA